ncbi:beta-galactosidase domain 4-containing protein [Escherichia coli]|uniref:beta-galactosidase domain 4-containing protein n=1 Tax=Escherichia coli TaxID=562 RepID=UPI00388D9B88
MASRWQAVKCLWMSPQGKQVIELPELPQPESTGQLWLTVRVVQPNATAWSEAGHISAAAVASGGKPQCDAPLRVPYHPATNHQRNGFLHRAG